MFVISMAGLSARLLKAGYTQPKYMLQAFDDTLFAHSVRSFRSYFDDSLFLFITLDHCESVEFVRSECRKLGIARFEIVCLPKPTRGQAESVHAGLSSFGIDDSPITIFNIDTAIPGFRQPDFINDCDGYLDVFTGSGLNWSYVRAASPHSNRVIQTAEKDPISNLCSTGLYHFRSAADFCSVFEDQLAEGLEHLTGQELYIAPLYNRLIDRGKDIRYRLIDAGSVIFFGTPAEYEALLKNTASILNNRNRGL